MRTINSLKNMYMGILTQVVMLMITFISRKVFVDSLGTEYLGINGLLTNILSMLSLVEGGIGTSIVYNLYKPLAENDEPKIISLIQLYKKLYGILAIVVFCLGMGLYPFLHILIKDINNIPFMFVVYMIFLTKNIISYLNAHKWSLINADQKGYILSKYNLIFNVITNISKIIVLIVTNNYILYLLIETAIFIIQNIWNGRIVNERYPYIKTKNKYNVDKEIRDNLVTNFKALILHKIGGYCVLGTDNILISIFVNLKMVGFYSNYSMIMAQLSSLIGPILGGVSESVGNLIATESKEKNYKIFKVIYLVNFWIYSVSVIFLYNLLEPFIDWWLGKGLLLDKLTFIAILINFYLTGLRISVLNFKSKAGIFDNDKYIPLIESIINLGGSIILAKYIGLPGIFIGTTISTICIPLWIQAKLVYNNVFNKSVLEYLKKYIFYMILTIVIAIPTTIICNYVSYLHDGVTFGMLVMKGIVCMLIPNIMYIIIFYKTEEFKYIWNIIKPIIFKFKGKIIEEEI